MTLNDLECPIHLKVRLVDGTLDVSLLRVSDSTIRIGVARGGGGECPPCGQLTRCFSAVAELLVLSSYTFFLIFNMSVTYFAGTLARGHYRGM